MVDDVFGIVGTVIASAYHVESVVAEGGFGVVYRAHHGGFRAPVALKLLKIPHQDPAQRAEFLNLFRAEAELLFRLSASLPNVVRPLHADAFTASDGRFVPYLVLEWLDGQTLDALVRQRRDEGLPAVPLRKLVRLLTPVARALERAHNFNGPHGVVSIVHRDLKPENLFVAQVAGEEVVKILDFGIARVKSAASQVAGRMSQNENAPMAFTPAYGAPEQWAPRHYGQTGPWTDVWGLALCLVEVIAARPLIEGDPATMMGIALDAQRRPTPCNEGVDVPDGVEAVFARALALDPRARQRDAGVFWNELVAALQTFDVEQAQARTRELRVDEEGGQRSERAPLRAGVSGSLPRVQPSAAVERALALDLDLEFDPVSASQTSQRVARAAAVSGAHYVPDLDLGPPTVLRRPSGAHAIRVPNASPPSVLDLDEAAHGSGLNLDLDLPAGEPVARRTVSSQGLAAVRVSASGLSGSMAAVREAAADLPLSGVMSTRGSSPMLGISGKSEPPRAVRPSSPPRASGNSPVPRAASSGSIPPPPPVAGAPFDTGFVTKVTLESPEDRPLARRLRPALGVLAGAIAVALFDPVYAALTGEVLEILGLRLSLLAGALLLLALGLGLRELAREASH